MFCGIRFLSFRNIISVQRNLIYLNVPKLYKSNNSVLIYFFPFQTHSVNISQSTFYFDQDIISIRTPAFADSIKEGDIRWLCEVGDIVQEDQLIGEIDTDKTALPVYAPFLGKVDQFLVADGERVTENIELLKIKRMESDLHEHSNLPKENSSKSDQLPPMTIIQKSPENTTESDNVSEEFLPFEVVPPILSKPIENPLEFGDKIDTGKKIRRVKMTRMRLRISERLKESQNTCAMLTTFNEVNMSFILSFRSKYKNEFFEKHGIKLGIMSSFIKAAAYALNEFPVVNAVIENAEIVYRDYIDISVAIATAKGLVVPIIKDVNLKNYFEIESRLSELSSLAKTNSLPIEDLYGGTFTISNGGIFGSLYGTPIINPPQSAILGIHATKERPVALNGKIDIMPMMYLALTYDHRLIDGREAVLFLSKIKTIIEDPIVMLLNL